MTGPFMFRSGWVRARLNSVKQPVAKAIEARDVVGLDPQIRRVGGGQVAGKADCVRRAPTIAAESDATDEPDEEDQGEVATPPFVQGGAQVVRRDVPCSAHGREPPADHRVSPPSRCHVIAGSIMHRRGSRAEVVVPFTRRRASSTDRDPAGCGHVQH